MLNGQVWLTNGAGSLTESTADAALLLLLSAARNFPEEHNLVADGRWEELGIGGVQYLAEKSIEPAGKTLGIYSGDIQRRKIDPTTAVN